MKSGLFIMSLIVLAILITACQHVSEPKWVTDIRNKIDSKLCSATDCEACGQTQCIQYSTCKLNSTMYACGPTCDAVLSYCVNVT